MFFKKLKSKTLILLLSLFIIPSQVLAYSDYVIAGGENIGIELNSDGIIVVGTYKVKENNPAKDANLQTGDKIIKVNDQNVTSINELLNAIESSNLSSINITYLRGEKQMNTTLNLYIDNNITKTGLYVKDSVTGVGTLTYIDPKTKLYGALGHEIVEKETGKKLEIKDGKIYNSSVISITPSDNGTPGEKNARYDAEKVYGKIKENTKSGIFGDYTNSIPNKKLYKVAKNTDIELGKATILTVIKEEDIQEFTINILKINNNINSTKNILFEVIDQDLIDKTGGIVQGMSGSPIIQNNNIIGAVTHVVVDDPKKGYGIFITTMLEEGEN